MRVLVVEDEFKMARAKSYTLITTTTAKLRASFMTTRVRLQKT